ncbi:MAG: acyltransferase [Planctomycetota bacterium]
MTSSSASSFFQHPHALVESDQVGEGTRVWAFAQVMKGAVVGRAVNIGGHAFIEAGAVIGDEVTIKNQVCVWDGVTIEDGVFVGPRVTFTNDAYPRSPRLHAAGGRYDKKETWLLKTVARAGCSIGAGATIVPGVTLGRGCTIGAGSVVTKDVMPFALVVGSPAKRIGDVCSCGLRLTGKYDTTTCESCGQTGAERKAIAEGEPLTSKG